MIKITNNLLLVSSLLVVLTTSSALSIEAPMRDRITYSGVGIALKKSIAHASEILASRAQSGDIEAARVIHQHGKSQAAIDSYNDLIFMTPPPLQPHAGASGTHYTPQYIPPCQNTDYFGMTIEEMRRLTDQSDHQINTRIAEICEKYNRGEAVFFDEEKELEFLRKQLDEVVSDRISFEQYKNKLRDDAHNKQLGAQVMNEKRQQKTEQERRLKQEILEQYRIKHEAVRNQFAQISEEERDKVVFFFRNSTVWKLLYLSQNERDFGHDRKGSSPSYEKQITFETRGLKEFNQDELEALAYKLEFAPEKIKRSFLQSVLDTRMRSDNIQQKSSIEFALSNSQNVPSPSFAQSSSSGASTSGSDYSNQQTPPPPPPSAGPQPSSDDSSRPQPTVTVDALQEQIDRMMRRNRGTNTN